MSERSLRLALRQLADRATLELDEQGVIVAGTGFGSRFGASLSNDLTGRDWRLLYAPVHRAAGLPEQQLAAAAAIGTIRYEATGMGADARTFPAEFVLERMSDGVGEARAYACVVTDLTAQRRALEVRQALSDEREAHARNAASLAELRAIVDGITPGIIAVDHQWRVVFANDRARALLRTRGGELRGRDLRRKLRRGGEPLLQYIGRALMERVPVEFEEYYPLAGCWFEVQVVPIETGAAVLFRDVSQRRLDEENLQSFAQYERVTGLPNRTLFCDRVDQGVAHAQRSGEPLSVVAVEIETDGGRGLEVSIRAAAERLAPIVRRHDTLAQIGPRRFAVLQNALTRLDGAATLAAKLVAAVAAADPSAADGSLTAHAGIAVLSVDGDTGEQLLRAAEAALEEVGDHVPYRFADEQLDRDVALQRQLERELHDAMAERQFRVFYQPVVDVGTRAILGFEALLRWQHPVRGLLAADEFLTAADEAGLGPLLTDWAVREALTQVGAWRDAGFEAPRISINVADSQLRRGQLLSLLTPALREFALDPARVQLELTEAQLLTQRAAAEDLLLALRRLRVRVCIDDFGSGYTPLGALRDLPVHSVKVAAARLGFPPSAMGILPIVQLTRTLGWNMTMKGIETSAQLSCIPDDVNAQGSLLGPPLSASEVAALLPS